ncbi:NAD(P)/FAD-dependent oxidoreductase [uncultured Corynebacterium sp.]|uniref:phytoene desaturase family protein n=1 Tax=uncultured Corynebacterium sp. TaxID=159447 RepID=UPI0025ED03AE|nr:NAD(P)/FAD-dependent oxidoreductase [uncultured Corynebacterium sp.]
MPRPPRTATVVGSGPNGLAAALVLARAGLQVTVLEAAPTTGGGLRSGVTVPGFSDGPVHDHCATTFPLLRSAPFFREFGGALTTRGLEFASAPLDAVHVLTGRRSATLHTSVSDTAAGLPGRDGRIWQASFGPLAARADAVTDEFLRPMAHLPRHPLLFAGFGIQAGLPASRSWRRFRTPEARALFAGIAAHAFTPLTRPGSAAAGMMLAVTGHTHGWPVAVGGAQSVTDALVGELESLGGRVVTDTPVTDLSQADADIVLLDTSVETAALILGRRLPASVARTWRRFRRGPAVAKVDYVIEGGIPWTSVNARRAGTVHLGGTAEQVAAAEQDCWDGRLPERPFTLVGQPWLADPSRSVVTDGRTLNPVWAYAHVPPGWDGTEQQTLELVTTQIDREAPGFRQRVLGCAAAPPAVVAQNPNNIGGDIAGGACDLRQLLVRPRLLHPYDTGVPGVYLCSSSTAPGGGVHFMCGMNAAQRALRVAETLE